MKFFSAASIAASVCCAGVAVGAPPKVPRSLRHHRDHAARTSSSDAEAPVHVGVLGAVAFPRPLGIEAMLSVDRAFSLGVEYSALPTTNVGGVDFGLRAIAADVRIFPLQSSFFIGVRGGRQHLSASASVQDPTYGTLGGSLAIDTWFLAPRAGFLWSWSSGLTVGIDAGVQIPLSHTESTTLPDGVAVPSAIASSADFFGKRVVPTVTLLQAGMMF